MLRTPCLQPLTSLLTGKSSRPQLLTDALALDPQGLTAGLHGLTLFRREVASTLTGYRTPSHHSVALRTAIEGRPALHRLSTDERTRTELPATAWLHLPTHRARAELPTTAWLHLPTHRHSRPSLASRRIGRSRPTRRRATLRFD